MKKAAMIITIFIFILVSFCSCFDYYEHENMVEYTKEEVLNVATNKYGLKKVYFDDLEIRGHIKDNEIVLENELKFINPDNLDASLRAFAGKNGNHDIQGIYSNFLAYLALALNDKSSYVWIIFNTNIAKDVAIVDTIGKFDYPYDVIPQQIDLKYVQSLDTTYLQYFNINLYKLFTSFNYNMFDYNEEVLTIKISDYLFKFYLENKKVVFDLFILKNSKDSVLIYSTSNCYQTIDGNKDYKDYFDIDYSMSLAETFSSDYVLTGNIKYKSSLENVLYIGFVYRLSYMVYDDFQYIQKTISENINASEYYLRYYIPKYEDCDNYNLTEVIITRYYILLQNDIS